MLRRFDVDWAGLGFTDADLDELAEHLLRIIQSFVIDPGRPPRRGAELRDYMRRWVGALLYDRQRKRLPSARTRTRRAAAEPHNRNFTQFLCRRVGLDHTCRPVRVGTCHLHVEVRVHGGDYRLQRALLAGVTSEIHAPSS